MKILVGRIRVRLFAAHSLKEKRKTLKSLMKKISRHHGASVREIAAQDLHQIVELGFSVTVLTETEARNMIYDIEQTIWNNIESEGELILYETECVLPGLDEDRMI